MTKDTDRSYEVVANNVRTSLRKCAVESIADVALQSFATFGGKGLDELRSAPWLSALVVKIALEDTQIPVRHGTACPPQLFDRLRQSLWEVSPVAAKPGTSSVFLTLRVMLNTQLQFQKPQSWAFLRWPALIRELPQTHPSREQFDRVIGMTPDAFVGICWALYAEILNGKVFFRPSYLNSLVPIFGNAVTSFHERFSRDLAGLRKELRKQFEVRLRRARSRGDVASVRDPIEVSEFPWLQRYPMLQHHSGDVAIWHPLIFARGMEQAVHNALSSLGQEYTDHFSKVFEGYVLQLLDDSGVKYLNEATFKATHSRSSPAVEAIITFSGGHVLIESKMSLFPDEVIASDETEVVFRKLRRLREAIVQGWRVTDLLMRTGSEGDHNFLLVVTSRQLNICSGEHLKRLFGEQFFDNVLPEGRFGKPTAELLSRLPPKNMFFLSIEEFERLCGCVRKKEVEMWSLLDEASAAQISMTTSSFNFDQLLEKYTKEWTVPDVHMRAIDEVQSALESALK